MEADCWIQPPKELASWKGDCEMLKASADGVREIAKRFKAPDRQRAVRRAAAMEQLSFRLDGVFRTPVNSYKKGASITDTPFQIAKVEF